MLAATERPTNFGKRLIYRILHDPATSDANAFSPKEIWYDVCYQGRKMARTPTRHRVSGEPIIKAETGYADSDRLKDFSEEAGVDDSVSRLARGGKPLPAILANNSS